MSAAGNPFAGLSEEEAARVLRARSKAATEGLPRRPALPHEADEGISWFFTRDGFERYEERMEPLREAWLAMGYASDPQVHEVVVGG